MSVEKLMMLHSVGGFELFVPLSMIVASKFCLRMTQDALSILCVAPGSWICPKLDASFVCALARNEIERQPEARVLFILWGEGKIVIIHKCRDSSRRL